MNKLSIPVVMEDGSDSGGSDLIDSDGSYSDRTHRDRSYRDGSRSSFSGFSSDDDSFDRRSARRRYDYSHRPNSYLEDDRISDLPDLILVQILSLLPLTDAIATARLSKRWRFLWKMVPNLAFSPYDHCSNMRPSALVSFIDKVLLLRERSSINKFSVQLDYRREFRSAVDVWLHVATGKNVEEIYLDLERDRGAPYTLPKNLYTNSSLVKLTLRDCNMNPNAVFSWPSLRILSISYDDELNDNSIASILSGCPVLESLELRKCVDVSRLNTMSASLKKLTIRSCDIVQISAPKVESLSILGFTETTMSLDLPSLLHATLNFELRIVKKGSKDSYQKSGRLMTYLLETLNGVEELKIGTWCIQVLSVLEMQNLTSPTTTFKRLILNTSFTRWDLPGMANLLRNSVSLETLVLNMTRPSGGRGEILLRKKDGFKKLNQFYNELDGKKYWNSQEGALVNSLQGLKIVKIIDDNVYNTYDRYSECLLGLLQVILKNARMLEKVVICTNKIENHGSLRLNSMEVAQTLLSFPKASPSAVILYYKS